MDNLTNSTSTATDTTITTLSGLGPDFLTQGELAEMLGWSSQKLIRLHVARKGPPKIKIGKSIYYYRPAVAAWLITQQKTEPQANRRDPSTNLSRRGIRNAIARQADLLQHYRSS